MSKGGYIVFLLFFLCFVSSYSLHAQKEANIWYFGKYAGLDFSTDPPTALTDSKMNTSEGSSSIADESGNLLFYSNGITIWNNNHDTMMNSNELLGHWSSTQSVVVVKKPASQGHYYILTVGAQPELLGLHYSELDMSLNNGLGGITAIKNYQLLALTTEKLAICNHANGEDVWVLTHKWNSDEIYAWLVTGQGIDTIPVISKTGTFITGSSRHVEAAGMMRVSPDGKYLALAHSNTGITQVFKFDNLLGKISNPTSLPNHTYAYGLEFSPSGRFLYFSEYKFGQALGLFQYDLAATNIAASEVLLKMGETFHNYGGLQLANNGKIYVSMAGKDSIGVINDPEKKGLACNFNNQQVDLKGGKTAIGLPSFNNAIFFKPTFEFQKICFHDTTHFSTYAPSADSVRWDFGDPSSGALNYSSLTETDHFYSQSGNYTVTMLFYRRGQIWETVKEVEIVSAEVDLGRDTTLCNDETLELKGTLTGASYLWQDSTTSATYQVSTPGTYWVETEVKGCKSRDSIRVDYNQVAIDLGNDTTLCENETLLLKATTPGASYLWQDSTSGSAYLVKGPGMYSVEITQGRCTASDSIQVQYSPLPVVDLGDDTVMCDGHTLVLNAGAGNAQYLWNTGPATASIEVRDSGSYVVRASNGCVAYDTILVDFQHCDCDFYFPTAFSPNGDGFNDTFQAVSDCAIYYYSLRIFTRWGEEVFATDRITEGWDGKFKGEEMPRGVYIYLLQQRSYNYPVGEVRKGNLMLAR